MPDYFLITGGQVYDPLHGVDGEVRDVWIANGRIVAPPSDPKIRPVCTLHAKGLVIMPGGVDMHCHIAGSKVNAARKLRPDDKRSGEVLHRTDMLRAGTMGIVPSTFATGYKYIGLGYTTAFDAAVSPLLARHTHEEFADTPGIDKGFFALVGNNHYLMQTIAAAQPDQTRDFLAWLLSSVKAFAPKVVNPGGVEVFKQHGAARRTGLDDIVSHFDITPRQILRGIARAANELRLPHPVHIHCNELGMPGNWRTTLETMRALEGDRGHLTHIQFHSYGGGDADEGTFCSRVEPLAEYINSHTNLTVDVGQVLFGPTTSMTGDGAVGYYLSNLYGTKWVSSDTELESGCGIAPIEYRNKTLVHAWQWAIGLEWYLMVNDPWKIAMSTDHPNGGSFLAYPQIIRLLMDRSYREELLQSVHPTVREQSHLANLSREYSLSEIAIITRAGPAKMLGLTNKGHLGVGADADITIYTPQKNFEEMFQLPRYVIKAGQILVEEGDLREVTDGKLLHVGPAYDPAAERPIADWFAEKHTVQFRNYAIADEELGDREEVPCGL